MPTAKKSLIEKIADIAAQVEPMPETGRNASMNFSFLEFAALIDWARPRFSEAGIITYPVEMEADRELRDRINREGQVYGQSVAVYIRVVWEVTHPGGESLRVVTWGEAQDTGDKAYNKAQTAAHKRLLLHLLGFTAEDNDASHPEPSQRQSRDPGRNHPTVSRAQTELASARKKMGTTLAEHFGEDQFREALVLASQYDESIDWPTTDEGHIDSGKLDAKGTDALRKLVTDNADAIAADLSLEGGDADA